VSQPTGTERHPSAGQSEHRRIFAMGGGGFSVEPDNPALDDYILSLSRAPEPRICLLPTAGGDADEQIVRFQATFGDKQCRPCHVSLFRLGQKPVPLRETILRQEIIYVGGGSLRNLLAIWRAHGLDRILREAWERGVVLAGLSAGSMCWFQAGVTKSAGVPETYGGLGLLAGSNSVHYDAQPDRRPVYLNAVAERRIPPGYGVDDGVGLLFVGPDLVETVSSRADARAYWVMPDGRGGVRETEVVPRFLGAAENPERSVPFDISEYRLARSARRLGD